MSGLVRILCLLPIGAALLSACSSGSPPATPEAYCNLQGYSAPLRQTLIVLDEADMAPESADNPIPANEPWHKLLAGLLPADEGALARLFAPRERLSILIARGDGLGLRPVFAGCLPFFSATEQREIAARRGMLGWFSANPAAAAQKALASFRKGLDASIFQAVKPTSFSQGGETEEVSLSSNGLVNSLRQSGVPVKLDMGVPRIILYSDMARYLGQVPPSVAEARVAGETAGSHSGLDFKGAEVHLVGLSGSLSARDMLAMFFLASHGELLSAGPSDSFPNLDAGPAALARFQGKITWPDRKQFRLHVRLATDADGHVASSWVDVWTTTREHFVPFHGKVDCEGDTCTFTGDHVFAQLWNPARGQRTQLVPDDFNGLTFDGLRDLAFTVKDGSHLNGSISDQGTRLKGDANASPVTLKFNATQTSELF